MLLPYFKIFFQKIKFVFKIDILNSNLFLIFYNNIIDWNNN